MSLGAGWPEVGAFAFATPGAVIGVVATPMIARVVGGELMKVGSNRIRCLVDGRRAGDASRRWVRFAEGRRFVGRTRGVSSLFGAPGGAGCAVRRQT